MKKVLLTMILFISSFFLFNLNVNAATYDRNLTENDFSLINDDFLDFRNQVLYFVGETKNYIIYYESSQYKAIISDIDSSYSIEFGGFNYNCWFKFNNFDLYIYKNKTLTFDSSITSSKQIMAINSAASPSYFYLDSNLSSITSTTGSNYYYLKYNGSSYSLPWKSASLYNIYLKNFTPPEEPEPEEPEPEDSYIEEKNLLSSFYTVSIEKISYLANEFATNYIFLTILGVFVLIFTIELFRRLLR